MNSTLVQQGVRAAQAQDALGALAWFKRAHELDPTDPLARAWLGQTLCHLGQRIDGLAHLDAAGRAYLQGAEPDFAKAHEVLGQLHAHSGHEQALALARTLALAQPGSARAQQLLAATCGQVNLTAEALQAAARAAELAPGDAMLAVLRASLEADSKQYDAAADRLEDVLDRLGAETGGTAAQQTARARTLFRGLKEMARVLDALGQHDAVFAQLDAAAQVATLLPEYTTGTSPRTVPDMVRAAAAGYTREGMARFAGDAFAEQPRAPVFVMGFFRSGTTLVQEVLRSHPGVFVSDEVALLRAVERELHRIVPGAGSVPDKLARIDRAGVVRLRAAYWSAAHGHHGAACAQGVFVDKFTLATVDLGLIATVFPDARVLFVVRDPRDVCLSGVMQLMVPTDATRHLLRLADAAALYAQVMGWWLQVREQLPLAHLSFRYEDAVADFEGTFRRVFAFAGIGWRADAAAFHRRAPGHYVASPSRNQVAQPLYGTSVARWRRYAAELAPVQPVLAPYVAAFGYPPA